MNDWTIVDNPRITQRRPIRVGHVACSCHAEDFELASQPRANAILDAEIGPGVEVEIP
jgi:hypothetical protein